MRPRKRLNGIPFVSYTAVKSINAAPAFRRPQSFLRNSLFDRQKGDQDLFFRDQFLIVTFLFSAPNSTAQLFFSFC